MSVPFHLKFNPFSATLKIARARCVCVEVLGGGTCQEQDLPVVLKLGCTSESFGENSKIPDAQTFPSSPNQANQNLQGEAGINIFQNSPGCVHVQTMSHTTVLSPKSSNLSLGQSPVLQNHASPSPTFKNSFDQCWESTLSTGFLQVSPEMALFFSLFILI